jgi:hypothetical protein
MKIQDITIKYYFYKIIENIGNFIYPIVLFFTPVKGIFITIGLFILLDTITGIWKSRKNRKPITSRGLSALISKMLLYESLILVTYCLDIFILNEIFLHVFSINTLITKIVALVLIYVEAKSINENYKEVKGIDLWMELKSLVSRTNEIKDSFNGKRKD